MCLNLSIYVRGCTRYDYVKLQMAQSSMGYDSDDFIYRPSTSMYYPACKAIANLLVSRNTCSHFR